MYKYNTKQIQILQIAETLFAEKGFDNTPIRDIAKAAHINAAMISYYFGSKEKLLEALILFRSSGLELQLENIAKQEITPLAKIDLIIELYINQLNTNRAIYHILYTEFLSSKRALNLKKFTAVKKRNITSLQKIIQEGKEKAVFCKNSDALLIYSTIMGIYFQFYINRAIYKEQLHLKTDNEYDHYINTNLAQHIQQIIKAFLVYEK